MAEVALGVIALVTAVKDMAELGSKIHESFAKASNNLRSARSLAEDVKVMLGDLQDFCECHHNDLQNSRTFRVELERLSRQLKTFEEEILPLVKPTPASRRRDRFIRAWDLWRKGAFVESRIRELKNEVKKIVKRYMMNEAMRTELKTDRISQSTIHGFQVVQRNIADLCLSTTAVLALNGSASSSPSSSQLDQGIVLFATSAPSSSAPILRTLPMINDEIVSTAYIKYQINNIVFKLETLSKLPLVFRADDSSVSSRLFTMVACSAENSMSVAQLRRHTVRLVTLIHDILEVSPSQTTITDGAISLTQLAIALSFLTMHHEAALVGDWNTKFLRMLMSVDSARPEYVAGLTLALVNHSMDLAKVDETHASIVEIEEACELTQRLPKSQNFQTLRSVVLRWYAAAILLVNNDRERSIDLARKSVRVLEDIVNIHPSEIQFRPDSTGTMQVDSDCLDQLPSDVPPVAIIQYASALRQLGVSLSVDPKLDESLRYLVLSTEILRRMSPSWISLHVLALETLVTSPASAQLVPETRLAYTNECAEHFRRLFPQNPIYYTRNLVLVLWVKADILHGLGREDEVLDDLKEATMLAKQLVQDAGLYAQALSNLSHQLHRLERFDDAAEARKQAVAMYQAPVHTQAERYYWLFLDLLKIGRHKEAAQAVAKSVTLYRILAVKDHDKWATRLGIVSSLQSRCLILQGDQDGALEAARESVRILEHLFPTDPDILDSLLDALYIIHQVFLHLNCQEETIATCSDARELYQALFAKITVSVNSDTSCADNLLRCQRLEAWRLLQSSRPSLALEYLEELLSMWTKAPSSADNQVTTNRTMTLLNDYAEIQHNLGHTDLALTAVRKARVIAEPYLADGVIFARMVWATLRCVFFTLGLCVDCDALLMAEDTLNLTRLSVVADDEVLVASLLAVAMAAIQSRSYQRAAEVSKEAVELCHKSNEMSLACWCYTSPLATSMTFLPCSLRLLSYSQANLGHISEALEDAREALKTAHKLKEKTILASLLCTTSCAEVEGNLASILIASGDLFGATSILEGSRNYISQRVDIGNGEFGALVSTLRALGILYCHQGRHVEGDAAAQECYRITKSLQRVFPSLYEQVCTSLRCELSIPIFQSLKKVREELNCEHQALVYL
ncbi:hypothetical protein D9619_012899 [Psilocybe cf. subviscida]|uniref:Uncharacterized protein n=1 Tax=Psilocybe cf. subviscida TaxID=2480587 RepID=A0A8H5BIH0_9AGAR|nr:hypothetical protein D9619_012899 [Psilocybe cf. subviscida]